MLLFVGFSASAQLKLTDFRYAVPFEQTNAAGKSIVTRPKSVLTAGEARPLSNDLYQAHVVRIENYQLDGKTNLIVRAMESFFDAANNVAFSTNRIELESPNGLNIAGTGFICYLTNFNLIISNDVRTRVQQRLLQTAPEVSAGRLQTNRAPGTNIAMTVSASRFELNFPSNIITYLGHVVVEQAQMTLESARLTVNRTTNGALERVVAEQDVWITNKVDHSRASGDLAVYQLAPVETLELSGHARWSDDQRQSRAQVFVYNPKQRHLRALGAVGPLDAREHTEQAWMSVPRGSIAQPEFGAPKTTNAVVAAPAEITANVLDLQMATTNHPSRNLVADGNVLIVSPADKSRATAAKAVFDESTGIAELSGNAVWQAGDRLAKGSLLRYDRSNGVFYAENNAFLKLPVSSFGSVAGTASTNKTSGKTNVPAPQFLQVASSSYTYTSNSLAFVGPVTGKLLEGEKLRATLACNTLDLRFTNELQNALANGSVKVKQLPWPTASGKMVSKALRCERLQVRMQPGGTVEQLVAQTNVFAEEQQWRAPSVAPVRSLFTADHVIADFFPRTNQVREGVATGNVSIFQQGRVANGERALYHGATDLVELLGHPTAEFPEAKITDAEILVWDRKLNKISGRKIKGQGEVHAGRTNQPATPIK